MVSSSSSSIVEFGCTPFRFGGDFAGEEKRPEIGSMPCSSRGPSGGTVVPVALPTTPGLTQFPSRDFIALGVRPVRAIVVG